MRAKHTSYLMRGLNGLGPGFISLDASRPWMIYWILHSLDLLDHLPEEAMLDRIQQTVLSCQDVENGGFGGGPQQLPHGAPMYASVLALLLIGTPEAYNGIDRPALYRFFMSLKHASGGFRMHDDGEVDARGTYTVIAVASLLNLLTDELTEGVADFAARCQTYEGGFGGEPWNEAHGGYTFCAFASLVILGAFERADLEGLRRWLCARQMRAEGGFQGRTNKLVDGCYSFWQGGAVALLDYVTAGRHSEVSRRDETGRLITTNIATPPPTAATTPPQEPKRTSNGSIITTTTTPSSPTSSPKRREDGVNVNVKATPSSPKVEGGSGLGRENPYSGAPRPPPPSSPSSPSSPAAAAADKVEVAAAEAGGARGRSGAGLEWMDMGSDTVEVGGRLGGDLVEDGDGLVFTRRKLQEYVLMCSQQSDGGLRDKPGKPRDFYHTCYTLSGLSVAQHCLSQSPVVVGNSSNLLRRTNPVYNIAEDKVSRAIAFFGGLTCDHASFVAAKKPAS
eukprot:g12507.t1